MYTLGDAAGERMHKLITNELPAHSHTTSGIYSQDFGNGVGHAYTGIGGLLSNIVTTKNTGGDQPHNTLPPYMAVHWIIKL